MKFFAILLLTVLALALAGPFVLRGPDGQPLMQTSDLEAGFASASRRFAGAWRSFTRSAAKLGGDDGKVEVFRWQDEDGRWHYSDEPPPGQTVETLRIDPDANRMAAPPPAPPDRDGSGEKGRIAVPVPSPLSVTPGKVGELIDDTRAVRDKLEARDSDMEAASRRE